MRRWANGVRMGVGAMVVIGMLAAMAPAASAAAFGQSMRGYRVILQNVYFN